MHVIVSPVIVAYYTYPPQYRDTFGFVFDILESIHDKDVVYHHVGTRRS